MNSKPWEMIKFSVESWPISFHGLQCLAFISIDHLQHPSRSTRHVVISTFIPLSTCNDAHKYSLSSELWWTALTDRWSMTQTFIPLHFSHLYLPGTKSSHGTPAVTGICPLLYIIQQYCPLQIIGQLQLPVCSILGYVSKFRKSFVGTPPHLSLWLHSIVS